MNKEPENKRPEPQRDGTVLDVVEFLRWVEDRGMMKQATAQSRRSSVSQVIETVPDISDEDVRSLDVDQVIDRFQNLASSQYSPASLKAYANRFRSSLADYGAWLESPADWSPDVQERRRRNQKSEEKQDKAVSTSPARSNSGTSELAGDMIRYPFPIRSGVMAHLDLPPDLSEAEAGRIASFVRTLAVQTDQESADGL